ncbi:UNVERIFIED_ORG: CRP/FNR family cyclic AMP-dependent transcriptional regulator [Methylobacterium sp. SuP10 SLI 274]|uniref:TIR domain-containing protein n=1 Tax=Methylorubrum extorquens TaxID=408 RepID=UPI00209C846D|nr:TIR domain-containing protein [Methylorubrum extorquens]MDF9861128.1 CRP/FNR family cyclic AMP-dependent transcriptional regulator [Methylorubrum pseudosasae]MDH6640041.1 CRP/FNR family cyclic AMP-dependent transcriptional regulator [Methylobacterium sp. SuP10 SLI 274]MDH6669201.1 CRP/FNR family cyclic AMP-dependent transcriptional regulator [Methylorubrum zatmanii]MCP1556785.1 putative nucleotide-binding protein [Methylorubrum extorquens]MDF9789375.1 CRP/FNR family cyclic AMP-dependent tra
MFERFQGDRGQKHLVEEIARQRLVNGTPGLAEALVEVGHLTRVAPGTSIIQQGGTDNDLFFIVVGDFEVVVNDHRVSMRGRGDQIGEMAAIAPFQARAATVTATTEAVVLKVTEAEFSTVADQYPEVWRRMAQELARRLEQRNALIRPANEKPRVFLFSSSEALPVARAIENALANDPFLTVVWANGVFKVTNYTLETLEEELRQSDFAVAVAHPDDKTEVRDEEWPTPRDNVVFELGFFMGSLGRQRAILMEPASTKLKLPSDLAGITTIKYQFKPSSDIGALMGPACNTLRDHIMRLGRNI